MKILFVIIVVVISWTEAMGQSRAERLFERGDYLGALKSFQKELESGEGKDGSTDKLKARVANCFFRLNDVVRAGQMYKSLNQDILGAEDLLFFATTLQRSGEYDKALVLADLVESLGGDMDAVERLKLSCDFAKEMAREKPTYVANKTNVDFAGFSSGVTYYKGKGLIVAAPGMGENAAKDSRGYKFTRLYNAIFSGEGGRLVPFADGLVDKYHIGAVTFTKDFNRIYYTKTILKKDGTSILKLLTAENLNDKWENVAELNINSDDYSCAHPCLYKDSLLFFVSDMPGGYGGKDIYLTTVNGAECGEVQNLGEAINTVDDELFPFMADDGKLYFASNGHIGLGGLDVFVSQMSNGGWSEVLNMGRPVNSSMDDFALVFRDTKCKEGYVSTNRGGTGYTDFLFSLKLLPDRTPDRERTKRPGMPGLKLAQENEQVQERPVVVPQKDMFTVDYRYAIQVGAFRNPVPRVYFENLQNVKVYLGYDNIYRYTIGEYPEEGIAQNDLAEVRKTIGDAFVFSVDKYIVQSKIRQDKKGDPISDDELLLIRLKNAEKMKQYQQSRPSRQPARRYLDKPRNSEIRMLSEGYTIVLMSANKVLDLSAFSGVDEIDVYAVDGGEYMYCSGVYGSADEAHRQLGGIRRLGFADAYVTRTDTYKYQSQSHPQNNTKVLKDLLSF